MYIFEGPRGLVFRVLGSGSRFRVEDIPFGDAVVPNIE